jgi:8-oxo-dGTP pyrophosphatase MutT (NUDIX family)
MNDWRSRLLERFESSEPAHEIAEWRLAGLDPKQSQRFRMHFPPNPVPAAVLVPLVERAEGLTVLLTERASGLKNHAAQVSFPGGRVDPGDAGPRGAALREAQEEIGLPPELVSVFGYMPDHLVISGFRVTPVLAFVQPNFELVLNPREVSGVFEVPLAHVFDPANHRSRMRRFENGEEVELYDIPYGPYNIWGATAGMLLTLYRLTTGHEPWNPLAP